MPGASTEEKGFAREPGRARAVYFRSKFRLLQTNIGPSLDGARPSEYDFLRPAESTLSCSLATSL